MKGVFTLTLQELMNDLANGELSNLAMALTGSIAEESHNKVILAINSALVDIYTRVNLLEREVLIESLDWQDTYYIRKEHARMDDTPGFLKYIIDTPEDIFTGDLVKVIGVCNEEGVPLPINDPHAWASVFLKGFDTIQFTHPGEKQVFGVQYQALHPKLVWSVEGYLNQKILINPALHSVLRTKVASLILAPMGGQEHTVKAQFLDASYESSLLGLTNTGDVGDTTVTTNYKLEMKGFL